MGLRVRKSFSVCKGVRVNLGKSGASVSFGGNGLRQTIHSSGRKTNSIGIPGTGISYVTSSSGNYGKRSYSSPAYTNRQNIQMQRQQQRHNEMENNKLIVQEHEALIDSIKSVHKECDEYINWKEIYSLKEPFDPQNFGPNQAAATSKLENFKPSFFEKIFKSLSEKKLQELRNNIDIAKIEDVKIYENWKRLNNLSKRILSGDIDAYFEVIDEMNPLDDLLEFGSDFEFGADTPNTLEVEFRVKSETAVPTFSINLTNTGKISKKDLTKTAYYDLIQDYVCSCTIRIARDMFSLLPIDTVIVHAVDSMLNTATGYSEDMTILSALFDKEKLQSLNFECIDPSDSMDNFNYNMKFMKTSGFRAVPRINEYI